MKQNKYFTGITDDPRKDPKVIDGWSIDEVLAESAPVDWKFKSKSELVEYPVWNQGQSSSCVAFAKAKQISIKVLDLTGVWIDFSPASIYQLRVNKPGSGMHISDANDIVNKTGVCLEALMKSQNLTEAEIDAVKRTRVGDLLSNAIAEAVVRYLYIPVDIDRIAQTIEDKRSVSLLIYANYDEYSRMVPVVLDKNLKYEQAPVKHEVVGVDYFIGEDGLKRIYINDSSHFGGIPVRELTEDFLEKRCILADAIDVFTFDPDTDKPKYIFSKDLEIGDSGPDVVALQDILKYEKVFPSNTNSTGYYGPITKDAVGKFQIKHSVVTSTNSAGYGRVGPLTRAKINIIYN